MRSLAEVMIGFAKDEGVSNAVDKVEDWHLAVEELLEIASHNNLDICECLGTVNSSIKEAMHSLFELCDTGGSSINQNIIIDLIKAKGQLGEELTIQELPKALPPEGTTYRRFRAITPTCFSGSLTLTYWIGANGTVFISNGLTINDITSNYSNRR